MEKQFKKYEITTGWVAFLVALITYGLTVEPTLSYWDCGEYIATSAKLQIGHPPGAPFFQMMGAFFAMFAPSAEKVALFVNWMSVLSSAFTILFLFFIITNLTKKMVLRSGQVLDLPKIIAILGSGFVGALAYTFSDSFWFNAVEAEVYAMAMLFMAVMFWLGIKWTDNLHQPRGDKWLILISLVVGLSFGVHFMALLTIPAIGMLYFFNSNIKKNVKNFFLANVISVAVLLLIFKLILPYTLAYFGYLEVFFVNSVGLPFNSGTIIAGISIILAFYITLGYTYRNGKTHLQTITLCILFVLIGFSTWVMIPIRANAHTVINENSPTDARLLLAYYKLEQYPETHLFYGPMFSDKYAGLDQENPYMNDKPKYERDYKKNKYVIVNNYENARMRPNSNHEGILPRMWSSSNATNYMVISGLLDFSIKPEYFSNDDLRQGVAEFKKRLQEGQISFEEYDRFLSRFKDYINVKKPSFWQNMQYLFSYQMNYMYWRYFMWNFVGRQNDIQGKKDGNGGWLSGINFIDGWRLGSQEHLPSDVLNNKARNTYFFLPLILGIIGLFYMLFKSERQTWVVFVLFMFTGLALKVYLNERPFEPRERDYALVGSFFTFAIWIGVGVYAIFEFLRKAVAGRIAASLSVLVTLLAVPVLMANQNWDDHSRAGRYTARAVAKAYLDSVKEDVGALLFTIGDNDTFGVWYAQEIENYRTDVRAINTSLLSTDWYIDQMKRKAYQSDPIPSQLTHDKYAYGIRDVVYYNPLTENTWNIKDFMNWIESEDPKTQMTFKNGQNVYFYPTYKVRIPVNKENVLKSGVVKPQDAHLIVEHIDIELPKSGIEKNRMLMLDIIANNDWKRPIYFTGGSLSPEEYIWMKDYLQLDGFVYKLVPIKTPIDKKSPFDMGRIDTDLMFDIVMRWDWGNMESPDIYHDPETRKNGMIFRGNLARLKEALLKEGKTEKAKKIIDLAMTKIPFEYFGYYFSLEPFIEGYYQTEQPQKARELILKIAQKYQEELNYYVHLPLEQRYENFAEIQYTAQHYGSLLAIAVKNNDAEFAKNQEIVFRKYLANFIDKIEEESLINDLDQQITPEDSLLKDSLERL